MFRVTQLLPEETRREFMVDALNQHVCLSFDNGLGDLCEVGCGQLHAVANEGVLLWHMGESRLVAWEEFNTVELFANA